MGGAQVGVGLVEGVAAPVVGQRDGLGPAVVTDVAAGAEQVVAALLVDVVAEVEHEVGLFGGDCGVGGEVAVLVVGAGADRHAQRAADRAGGAGAVSVRPVGETYGPALKRYQYGRPGRSPVTVTCTLCAQSRTASSVPLRTTVLPAGSARTCHWTGTGSCGIPPNPSSASGSGASRVHSTNPPGSGSPLATPSVNGSPKSADGTRDGRPVVNPAARKDLLLNTASMIAAATAYADEDTPATRDLGTPPDLFRRICHECYRGNSNPSPL
ncbi:hypothetical protein GCM10020001_001760 [Nonomuraea salmonea]